MAESTPVNKSVSLEVNGNKLDLPLVYGSENECGIDVSKLRAKTGCITYDDGYRNTGSCKSAITYIDGEQGILRYRGIPIEQLAEHSTFVETAWLVIWGELPTAAQLRRFRSLLTEHEMLHEGLYRHFDGFPSYGHPMAILSAMINAVSCYHPDILHNEIDDLESATARLLSKVRTIAAASYKTSIGQPITYPKPHLDYCSNFLHMLFSIPFQDYVPDPDVVRALNLIFILHADHEQNCSTSTVRMVASSGANLFASCSAGVCALWGPLHGGANTAVINQLDRIQKSGISVSDYVEEVKQKKSLLYGFGHAVYRNYDPRAKILKAAADKVLLKLGVKDKSLEIAKQLEEIALSDPYFTERKLYPNVDFYSGIIMRAMGIPVNMFTVLFAIGRMPGWIANWKEVADDADSRIYRPRQIYTGSPMREYIPIDQRG